MVGWSGCGLGTNGKRAGAGTNAVKNSGYFLASNVAVMLKIETRPGCTRTKSCDASRETKKNKKVTSKQEQRLNFLTFGFAMMISVKNLKAIKRDLCRFSMTLKTVIFFLVQIQKVIFCKNRRLFFFCDNGNPDLKDFLLNAHN